MSGRLGSLTQWLSDSVAASALAGKHRRRLQKAGGPFYQSSPVQREDRGKVDRDSRLWARFQLAIFIL